MQIGPTGHPERVIDFAYRGIHVTTLAAKAITNAYYGQKPRYSYFAGCSDGGREGLMEAQRYPEDFVGITAGAARGELHYTEYGLSRLERCHQQRRERKTYILTAAQLPIFHTAVLKTLRRFRRG